MKRPQLARDERGAIMLFAVFMAVLLTGALYYVVGIGDAIAQRERMQDAADAAAFSAAVLHARGMNVLVLINMVMAALLAIIVALQLVEALTTIAIATIAVLSFLNPGLAVAVPPLASLRTEVQQAKNAIKPTIDAALDTLHAAAVGVREAVPAASVAVALAGDVDRAGGLATIVLPARATLPSEDGTFAELCEHATDYLGDLTSFALAQVKMPKLVADAVGDALSDLTSAGSGWFCGSGDKPPKTETVQHVHYPTLPSRAACLEPDPGRPDYDKEQHEQACEQAEQDERDAEPDHTTGRCRERCEPGGPYEQSDLLAREQCAPRAHHDRLRDFVWQEKRFTRRYVRRAGVWLVQSDAKSEEASAIYTRKRDTRRPCAPTAGASATEWNLRTSAAADPAPVPVCGVCAPPAVPGYDDESLAIECVQVTRIFGCNEEVKRQYELGADSGVRADAHSTGMQRVPQVLAHELMLGDEAFAVRALVRGPAPGGPAEGVLRIASWGRAPEAGIGSVAAARALGRTAAAQAEYYFDVHAPNEPSEDFMWSMRWKARFRRFRLPARDRSSISQPQDSDPGAACARATAGAATEGDSPCRMLEAAGDAFLH